jgi:DNA anti-recombination protein RmuC
MLIISAVLGGSGFATLITAFSIRRKNNAKASDINVQNALQIEEVMKDRFTETNNQLVETQRQFNQLQEDFQKMKTDLSNQIAALTAQVSKLKTILDQHNIDYSSDIN